MPLPDGDAICARADPGRPQRARSCARSPSARPRALDHRPRRGARRTRRSTIYFDAQLDAAARERRPRARSPPASTSTARSRSRRDARRARSSSPGSPRRRREERRRAGQAVPARPAQAQAAGRQRLLRPHPLGARRVRLLGLRGRLAGRRSGRRGTTAARTAAASSLDMFCHWRYVLDNLFGPVRAGLRARRDAHPDAGRRGRAAPTTATADDAAYAIVRARGRRSSRRSTRRGAMRVYRDELLEIQVDGTAGQRGRRPARLQDRSTASTTPKPVWNPDIAEPDRVPRRLARRCPTTASSTTHSRSSGSMFLRHVVDGRAVPLGLPRGREGRAARRARTALVARAPLARRAGAEL